MTKCILPVLTLALAVLGASRAAGQPATEEILHNFGRVTGVSPNSPPVLDAAGNLYGTTQRGGSPDQGTVYVLSSAGNYKALHTFDGGAGGSTPNGVVVDPAGNVYGTTTDGGNNRSCPITNGCGVIYKIDPAGHYSVLYNFADLPDGAQPNSALAIDAAGNLYGTTSEGGDNSFCTAGCGVVFKLDQAGNETTLLRFTNSAGGYVPIGAAVDSAGSVVGVTKYGGTDFGGVLFKLDPSGQETVLHNYTGKADGGTPNGAVLDAGGNLYGTTEYGGAFKNGVIYKFDTAGNYTVVYSFPGGANGSTPITGVIGGSDGNLYGTAYGGDSKCGGGCGIVFELDHNGNETVLFSFDITDGWAPVGIARDSAGNLYGATVEGGTTDGGVLFKVGPSGNEQVLFTFPNGNFGFYPSSGVVSDAAGNLYGTTADGGLSGGGVLYKLSAANSYTVLYRFEGGADGFSPRGGVISDSAGNLYGVTDSGGLTGYGVVYKVDASGQETVLFNFTGGADGQYPTIGLVMDSAGDLYGTTGEGGDYSGPCAAPGCGVVYKVSADGYQTVLYTFTGGNDGGSPSSGVILDAEGNLYGTTLEGGEFAEGVIYKIDAAGDYSVIYNFPGGADGGLPSGNIVRDEAGNIYGAAEGGSFTGLCPAYPGCGILYRVDPSGNETVLHAFTGGAAGSAPIGGIIRDSAGNLYGNTAVGGSGNGGSGSGLVYKLDTAGTFSILYSFDCDTGTGCYPGQTLMRNSAGEIFGTTNQGGSREGGVVFKITP